ncbi:hypothetical protein GGX14DRAFT_428511 [Mycena pura]|uniref:BAG domain-containing protein n=1 Tax=Mycena pura TaxID=153505 RepID=A0AAD6YKW3_9AGAR|nr:hypothetical protein GGX14DRAFT_428511 [Mycena pura]
MHLHPTSCAKMFSFYPRPQPAYYQPSPYYHPSPYYQSSPYARALAQQQQQQERARAYAQELERQRAARSRYFPDGYDEPESDEEDRYLTPHQRALLAARQQQRSLEAARKAQELAMRQQQASEAEEHTPAPRSPTRRSVPTTSQEPAQPSASPSAAQIPLRRSASPSAQPPQTATPKQSPPPSTPSPERLDEAATKIQTQYRIHRALRAIAALAAQFESLKSSFTPPTSIDYVADGRVVPVPASAPTSPTTAEDAAPHCDAKLAYTPTNAPLHMYTELLSRLLVSLDAVESRGDARVRDRRREAVRAVEAEAARIEAFWRSVWAAHEHTAAAAQEEEEVRTMVIDADAPPAALAVFEEGQVHPMVVDAVPELADSGSESESDEDGEPEFVTPPATPASRPMVLPESDLTDDGVLVDMHPEDEDKEFIIVPELF